MSDDVTFLRQLFRDSMELQAQEELNKTDDREPDIMKPLQVRAACMHLGFSNIMSLQSWMDYLCLIRRESIRLKHRHHQPQSTTNHRDIKSPCFK